MRHRPFGPACINVPIIGQGTWRIADAKRDTAVAALRRGMDLGMTHIDTAEMYEGAEAVVAEAIAGRRAEVFLVSKVLPSNASHAGTIAACDRSLQRLKTDHLDVYLLHWPGRYKLEDTIAAFERLVEQGKIRAWGLSNFDVRGLQQAERIAGPGRIACNQVLYHLQERAIEHAVLPWCAERRISIVAYSPFGSGDFPAPATPGGKTLQRIADANQATPRQVALSFLTRAAQVFAIPKAADENHATDNAAAGRFELAPPDIAALEAAFPLGREPRHLPMI
jgi:diketogulonate reductase-like aldo/keto reductase